MTNYTFDPNATPPQGLELECLESRPKEDAFLIKLGTYIADGINYDHLKYCPEHIAVREIIDYDAVNIDLSRFPLLKLYRQNDQFKLGSNVSRTTKAVIAYCLTYPEQDELPSLLNYMSERINKLLDVYHYQHEDCQSNVILEDRNAEYRIQVNEATRVIYPFLRFNFSFREQ